MVRIRARLQPCRYDRRKRALAFVDPGTILNKTSYLSQRPTHDPRSSSESKHQRQLAKNRNLLPRDDLRLMDCRRSQRRNRASPDPDASHMARRNFGLQKFRVGEISGPAVFHLLARHHGADLALL